MQWHFLPSSNTYKHNGLLFALTIFDICLLFSNALLSILLQFYCLSIAASHILLWQNMNYECVMKGD